MRRAIAIQGELAQTRVVEDLTEVFESIASMHIAKIHTRVVASKQFFAELWKTYTGLRVDPKERLVRDYAQKGRNIFVAITAEGKLSGSADEQVVHELLGAYNNPAITDVLAVGSHGAQLLNTKGVRLLGSLPLPASDTNLSIGQLIDILNQYNQISVFYQTYESLRIQKPARIELISAVRALGEDVTSEGETVSSRDYIFEPSIREIADYMESVMLGVAVIQVIMESKLAHYANRFNTMSAAKKRAGELTNSLKLSHSRAKRSESDERTKEIIRTRRALTMGAFA